MTVGSSGPEPSSTNPKKTTTLSVLSSSTSTSTPGAGPNLVLGHGSSGSDGLGLGGKVVPVVTASPILSPVGPGGGGSLLDLVGGVGTTESSSNPNKVDFDDYETLPVNSVTAHMMAGALAGIMEHCVMYPLDSVKVWEPSQYSIPHLRTYTY